MCVWPFGLFYFGQFIGSLAEVAVKN